MQNKAAVMHGTHDVRLEDVPVPEPGPNEVLVEIRAVGVCGSDVHYYEEGRIGSFVVDAPLILGHESMGTVVALGENATKHEVGDRVTLEPGVPDGTCRECRAGRYNLCPNVQFFATPPIDGAFTNFVSINEDFAFALPDSLSDNAGALMEPLSVGIWACKKGGVTAGDHVLITGAGPIGLVAMQVAFAQGATEVTLTDVADERLRIGSRLGATRTLNVAEDSLDESGIEADVLIECSGNERALTDGIGRRGRGRYGTERADERAPRVHPDQRDPAYGHVSLREHLPYGDRPRRLGKGGSRRHGDQQLRSPRDRRGAAGERQGPGERETDGDTERRIGVRVLGGS
jgi:L-iditol 2-dehydrogenase